MTLAKVFVSSIEYDPTGYVAIDALPGSDYGVLSRRANKIRTLDGGVVSNDFGFNHADREFLIHLHPTDEQDAILRYLVEFHPLVHVSTDEGVFTAIPQYAPSTTQSVLTLSIRSSLT
jgi:hypothetical protein